VTATRRGSGWLLHGVKLCCSGARICTDALVAAAADDGPRLFAVATERLEPDPASWPATGMAGSDTLDVGPHALAHLGAVDLGLRTARAAPDQAADEIDADPGDLLGDGPLRAVRVRTLTEAVATDVMARTGRALGAGPLGHDEAHSRAVADLTVYLRQHHAERDLARLGEMVAERGDTW
jgi:alkylation response protein AidB-like acyl-CoA dehydrogenase